MAFRLVYDAIGTVESFGDDARFFFDQAGHLVIEDKRSRRTFSPIAWHHLEEGVHGRAVPDYSPSVAYHTGGV
jgi:hypothetical protein